MRTLWSLEVSKAILEQVKVAEYQRKQATICRETVLQLKKVHLKVKVAEQDD